MKIIASLRRRPAIARLQFPVLLLITLLQRSPALRFLSAAADLCSEAPSGFVLKSSVATFAALGAVQTLAGATSYQLVTTSSTPITATMNQPITPVGFTVTNTIDIGSWKITGTIPPGLTFSAVEGGNTLTGSGGLLDATTAGTMEDDGYGGTTSVGGNAQTTPILMGTPTAAGSYTLQLTAYEFGAAGGLVSPTYSVVVTVAPAAVVVAVPTITTNPASVTVAAGGTAIFTAAASDPTATIQWTENGVALPGATGPTLTVTNVQAANAGAYAAVATNSAGSVTTVAATLTVTPAPTKPAFTIQPTSITVPTGATASFNATATGATSYQWLFNGVPIAGATNARLVLSNVASANVGTYSVIATNAVGATTSASATLGAIATPTPGRLINLSVLTLAGSGGNVLTVGFTTGGSGTSGQQSLLIRGVGPALAAFGLPTAPQPDPTLAVINQSTHATVVSNDNWGATTANGTAVTNADNATGAFPLTSVSSLDAATVSSLAAGGYSVQISANGAAVGNVLAEVYDDTPANTYTLATPRLINLSCLSSVAGSGSLVAGFTIGGSTSRTVLIRATGPALGALGVPGTLADPQIVLIGAGTVLASNAGWGGDPAIAAASNSVGAFAISNPASLDSVVLITLPPGGYSATASSVSGASGTCLIEVYEVP